MVWVIGSFECGGGLGGKENKERIELGLWIRLMYGCYLRGLY